MSGSRRPPARRTSGQTIDDHDDAAAEVEAIHHSARCMRHADVEEAVADDGEQQAAGGAEQRNPADGRRVDADDRQHVDEGEHADGGGGEHVGELAALERALLVAERVEEHERHGVEREHLGEHRADRADRRRRHSRRRSGACRQ